MGQSSFGGGSLNSASSRKSNARSLHGFFVRRPMVLLAIDIAIPGVHTSLARLETSASLLLAALGAAGVHLVHPQCWVEEG